MASFESLPAELINEITSHLLPGSIPAWARVNAVCRAASSKRKEQLQEQYQLLWPHKLLGVILVDPGLIWFVRSIPRLRFGWPVDKSYYYPDRKEHFSTQIAELGMAKLRSMGHELKSTKFAPSRFDMFNVTMIAITMFEAVQHMSSTRHVPLGGKFGRDSRATEKKNVAISTQQEAWLARALKLLVDSRQAFTQLRTFNLRAG